MMPEMPYETPEFLYQLIGGTETTALCIGLALILIGIIVVIEATK